MTTAVTSAPVDRDRRPSLKARKRPIADTGFRIVALSCGLLVLAILVLIAVSTTNQALPAFRHAGLSFVTGRVWDPSNGRFGALAFVWGTLLTSTIALVLAIPVSLGIALFLTEVAPRGLRTPVVYVVDLLAAVPSVVFGLWGILFLSPKIGGFYGRVSSATHGIPVLGTLFSGRDGRSFMTAGLIVALMITPIITSLSREVFATVPRAQKEAALALGATRWEMLRGSVLSYGRSGVIGAVIGSSPRITFNLFRNGDAMASVIANQFGEASDTWRSALIGLGVLLFALTIAVNIVARAFIARAEQTMGPAS